MFAVCAVCLAGVNQTTPKHRPPPLAHTSTRPRITTNTNTKQDKLKAEWDTSEWPVRVAADIPRQANGCDCGVFALLYADAVGAGRAFDFTARELELDARAKIACRLLDLRVD